GVNLRLGFALSEELAFQPHYSLYQQKITLPDALNNCQFSPAAPINGGAGVMPGDPCFADGEASLPVRKELANGAVLTSLVGYTLAYSTLDNNKSPTSGLYASITQDVAGVGGDVNFLRTTADTRTYYEVLPDIVGVLHLQGGHLTGW